MQEYIGLRRLVKMKIKYELEASDFFTQEEISHFLKNIRNPRTERRNYASWPLKRF